MYVVVYVKNVGKNLVAGQRMYDNTRLSLSLLSLPSRVFVIHFRRNGKCTRTCVHHTDRLQRSELPLGAYGERLAESAIIPLISSDSTLRVHPPTNTRNVTTRARVV